VPFPDALSDMEFCAQVRRVFPVLLVMDAVGMVILGFMVVEDVFPEVQPPEFVTLKIYEPAVNPETV
jgi:hypothetical protein